MGRVVFHCLLTTLKDNMRVLEVYFYNGKNLGSQIQQRAGEYSRATRVTLSQEACLFPYLVSL